MENTRLKKVISAAAFRKRSHKKWDKFQLYMYVVPSLLIITVVTVFPLLYTFFLSFQSYDLARPNDNAFVGLSNYKEMVSEPLVTSAIWNTIIYTVLSVTLSLIIGLALAMLVKEIRKGKSILRTLFFMPMLLAPVVVGVMWRFLFNYELGIVNHILTVIGFEKVDWLGTPSLAMFSIIFVDVWQWTPYVFLVLLAGLESLPQEPFEAAEIDGASKVQTFRFLTIPYIMPLILIATIFRVTWAFRGFDSIYTLTQGGPGTSTETLAMSVWRLAFVRLDVGLASAVSVVMFVILTLFSLILLRQMSGKLRA